MIPSRCYMWIFFFILNNEKDYQYSLTIARIEVLGTLQHVQVTQSNEIFVAVNNLYPIILYFPIKNIENWSK